MNYQDLCQSLTSCISEIAFQDVEENTLLLDDQLIDSFAVLAIITHIEDDLGIMLDPDEVTISRFASIATLASWLLQIQQKS
jgi:acyl carrier protein